MLCPIACMNWTNGSNAGVWGANFNNARDNANTNVGFRADSASPRSPTGGHGGAEGDVFLPRAKSWRPPVSGSPGDGQRREFA